MKPKDFFSRRAWKRWAYQGFSDKSNKRQRDNVEQEEPTSAKEIRLLTLLIIVLLLSLGVLGWYIFTQ